MLGFFFDQYRWLSVIEARGVYDFLLLLRSVFVIH